MTASDVFKFIPIGIVHSPFKEKFAIPRQPGLAKIDATVELLPPFAHADAVCGLEQFSHIWISFVFHAVASHANHEHWRPLVRPPRLGGNEKIGVFATRSTHRPNPIGLSVVELLRIDTQSGVKLHIRSGDLLDGTPVLDIKPYIPYADAIADARAGFAQLAPRRLDIRWQDDALRAARKFAERAHIDLQRIIEEVLCFDPRPAYQNESDRLYGVNIANCNVRFRIDVDEVIVVDVEAIEASP